MTSIQALFMFGVCMIMGMVCTFVSDGWLGTWKSRIVSTLFAGGVFFIVVVALVASDAERCPNHDCYCRGDVCITPVPKDRR